MYAPTGNLFPSWFQRSTTSQASLTLSSGCSNSLVNGNIAPRPPPLTTTSGFSFFHLKPL